MRNLKQPHGPLEPQDIEELLPWYATGRLSREEARGIEAALKTMPDLAAKLATVQRERDAVARGGEAVEPPPPNNLQRLLRQVETTRQVRPGKAEKPVSTDGWLAGFFGRRLVWQLAFGIACIGIAVMALRFYDPAIGPDLGATTDINGAVNTATLVITFQPQASNAEVTSLLRAVGAIVVDGPRPGGSYVVRLPSADPQDVSTVMERLLTRKDLVQTVLRGS